jgi:hypothetical protein
MTDLPVSVGPNIQIHGALCTDATYTEVLSPALPMYYHIRDLDARLDLARLLTSTRHLFNATMHVYTNPEEYTVSANQIQYPYPRDYKDLINGSIVAFTYEERVDPNRLVFRGRTDEGSIVFIKFGRGEYGTNAHLAAVELQATPMLRCSQLLPGGWWMIVLDPLPVGYVAYDDIKRPAAAAKAKVKKTVKLFHQKGFVHGDLRPANIFLKCHGSGDWDCQIIDFDWAGEVGVATYPINVGSSRCIWRPRSYLDGHTITPEDDMAMVEHLEAHS